MRGSIVLVVVIAAACSSRGDHKAAPAGGSAAGGSAAMGSATRARSGTPLPRTLAWTPLPAAPPFLATRVRGSGQSRCAVARDGRIACWGNLGGTPYLHTGVAHTVAGITDAVDATMFVLDLCIVRRDGSGGCISEGETQVPPFPPDVVQLEQSSGLLCVRDRAGEIHCHNFYEKTPFAPIAGITGATSLTCMGVSCCAITPEGVRCFGDSSPDIGMAESRDGRAPSVTVPPATEIAFHSFGACVRTQAGGAHCWGDAAKLTRASGVRGVVSYNHDLCAILDDGRVECTRGIQALAHVVSAHDRCVVHDDGSIHCTGTNLSGELGDGRPTFATTPQKVPDLGHIVDLRVTETQACAIARDQSMTCWGWTAPTKIAKVTGLFGGGDEPGCTIAGRTLTCLTETGSRTAPLEQRTATITARGAIKTFAMFGRNVCIVEKSGALSCGREIWDEEPTWQRIASTPVAELAEQGDTLCARLVDGRVGCFEPDPEEPPALAFVPGIADAIQISGGPAGACVLTRGGDVACWTDREPELRVVEGLRGATVISTRGLHVCGLVKTELWCGGLNTLGQLGDGTRVEPPDGDVVRVKTSFAVAKFGVAGQATCALSRAGEVWCWGSDQDSQLGQGRVPQADSPSRVVGIGPR